MVRDFLIKAEARKPSVSQVHPYVFDQAALTGDSIQIADQQDAEEHFWINRGPTRVAVARLQGLSHESEIDVAINEP